jgi:hypothetical protein
MKLKLFIVAIIVIIAAGATYIIKGPNLQKKNPDAGLTATEIKTRDNNAKENWAYSLGIQAYVYGLPLKIIDRERRLRLNERKLNFVMAREICPCAPINTFGHMKKLATSDDSLPYTPNNDTIYSGLLLELKNEPIIVTLPDVMDRYWSAQIADAYLENLPYLGSRATGGKGGNYMFAGPSWQGDVPAGVTLRRMPTNSGVIALRYGAVNEKLGDIAAVLDIQKQVFTTGLSFWGQKKGFGKVTEHKASRKQYDGELAFFEQMADLLAENPPRKETRDSVGMFQSIGIELGKPFDPSSIDEPTRKGLVRALEDVKDIMTWKVKYRGTAYSTRWNNLHEGTYGFHFINRAEGALEGLLVHDREEGVYFSTYEDGTGALLEGSDKYVMHFEKDEVPNLQQQGFWSLTMYGTNFQLVENEIDRFAIGDRNKDMKYNADGSLTIYIQNQAPQGFESNWLPSPPEGLFRINFRIYLPNEETRNPSTLIKHIPGLKKVN